MYKDPRHQQKEGTNQDVSLTNRDENVIDDSLENETTTSRENTETGENTSLTQLAKDDGEITSDFIDGDDSSIEAL